ncbi:MAG: hypothetical protein V7K60_17265 [Nostoc sp.]
MTIGTSKQKKSEAPELSVKCGVSPRVLLQSYKIQKTEIFKAIDTAIPVKVIKQAMLLLEGCG